jgi:hypothetical protein
LLVAEVTDGVTDSAQTLITVVERPGSYYICERERALQKLLWREIAMMMAAT